jgi:hypothetical protein
MLTILVFFIIQGVKYLFDYFETAYLISFLYLRKLQAHIVCKKNKEKVQSSVRY